MFGKYGDNYYLYFVNSKFIMTNQMCFFNYKRSITRFKFLLLLEVFRYATLVVSTICSKIFLFCFLTIGSKKIVEKRSWKLYVIPWYSFYRLIRYCHEQFPPVDLIFLIACYLLIMLRNLLSKKIIIVAPYACVHESCSTNSSQFLSEELPTTSTALLRVS